jgi:hypothetical protein
MLCEACNWVCVLETECFPFTTVRKSGIHLALIDYLGYILFRCSIYPITARMLTHLPGHMDIFANKLSGLA